jgi:hypothetical protein
MTSFIYRDPFAAHETAPDLTADEQTQVDRFGIHETHCGPTDAGGWHCEPWHCDSSTVCLLSGGTP